MQALTTWWESRWARPLDLVAGVAALLVVSRLVYEEGVSWLLWALVALLIFCLSLIRWPYGALITLIGMSVMPRFYVELYGWKVRPEQVATVIVAAAVAIWLWRKKTGLGFEKLDYWVLGYLALNYLSSAFTSPQPSSTLKWALMNNLGVLPYFLIRLLVRDTKTLEKVCRILLGIAIVEVTYGLCCYLSHLMFGTTTGMEAGQYLANVAAPYGTLYEPNLFGAYSACCAAMMLSLYFLQRRHRAFYILSFLIASLATLVSFSRAALLALVVATAWVFWKGRQRHPLRIRRLIVLAVALIAMLIVIVAITPIGGILQERLSNLLSQGLTEESTITRLLLLAESVQNIANHPLFGSGTASFQLFFDWSNFVPEWAGTAVWIGNFLIRILHDTGVFGLFMALGFIVSLVRKIHRGLRRPNSVLPYLLALCAGAVVYGITFQFTDGSTLAFCSVHLGVLASAAILSERGDEATTDSFHAI
jgi:oligosaccharide repeat unit polymerase